MPSTGWHPKAQAQIGAAVRKAARTTLTELVSAPIPKKRSKYGNKPTHFRSTQGFELVAASKAEARGYAALDAMIVANEIVLWVPQVSFLLQGGSRYRCDALVWWATGRVTVRDYKGMETPAFKIKRGLMMSTYGLEIEVVE